MDNTTQLIVCGLCSMTVCLTLIMLEEEMEEEIEVEQVEGRRDRRRVHPRRKVKQRSRWTYKWVKDRPQFGQYENLMNELEAEHPAMYKNFQRVTPDMFMEILERVERRIQRQDTFWRKALPAGLKLAVTLRYLASGDSYKSLAFAFRVPCNTICRIIPEVCQAIIDTFMPEVIPMPTEEVEWKAIAHQFYKKWNLPHCIGAVDGKHVSIKCPARSGSIFYNYKGFFSIVLMAVVDADYRFVYINVGANGAGSDGGVFAQCNIKEDLEEDRLGVPPAEGLPNAPDKVIPYFLVGDEAFPLKTWLMKPIPQRNLTRQQRIYNYRLSRGRRVVENAFGILASRWRCMLTTMPQRPETVQKIVVASCCLHNLLRRRKYPPEHGGPAYHRNVNIPGNQLPDLGRPLGRNPGTTAAKAQRNALVEYFNSPAGCVPWQEDRI